MLASLYVSRQDENRRDAMLASLYVSRQDENRRDAMLASLYVSPQDKPPETRASRRNRHRLKTKPLRREHRVSTK